jgi:uroporphyrinogen-III synthase
LSRELERLGVPVLRWPAIGIVPADTTELAQALKGVAFDWIVLTSRHGVAALTELLPAPPPGARIAAVGPASAAALRERGWPVHLTGEAGADSLLRAFEAAGIGGRRILHPASSRALPALGDGLKRLGAEVVSVEAYRTVPASLDVESCRATLARGDIGAVTFASPSAVSELEHALGCGDFRRLLTAAAAVAIGPTTAHELTVRGVLPVVAEPHTLRGLAMSCYALARGIDPGCRGESVHHAAHGAERNEKP